MDSVPERTHGAAAGAPGAPRRPMRDTIAREDRSMNRTENPWT